jgi:hypothetical protein
LLHVRLLCFAVVVMYACAHSSGRCPAVAFAA